MEYYMNLSTVSSLTTSCAVVIVSGMVISTLLRLIRAPGLDVNHRHIFITGGSTGLGLASAKAYAARGAKITIIARSTARLETAKEAIQTSHPDAQVFAYSCDVTNFEQLQKAVEKSIVHHRAPIYQLICCAGFAIPGYFLEQSIDVFRQEMDVNYFGSMYAVKAVVPNMIENPQSGQRIVFVSSACAYIGFIGFSQYCATKYALRGFADSLRNEFKLYDIGVSIFYPGNMDTPGYELEEKTKPKETQLIEGSSALVSPEAAAETMINGIRKGDYAITNDIGVWVLRVVGNGMAPRSNTILEMLLMPLAVLIQTVYLLYMDHVVTSAKTSHDAQSLLKKKQV